ncbi:MAG: MFS transporter [Saccharolobus sp.]
MDLRKIFEPIDEKKFDIFHWKAMITTGMGVFTDGYDLSSIGIVLGVVLASLGIKGNLLWESLIAGSALMGAAIGSIIFGILANKGRKTFYGVDVALLTIGALLQAFVQTPLELVIVRFLVGLGTGADYVLSPLIMAEHANAKDRGKLIALGFGFIWGLGATTAAGLYLLLSNFVSPDLLWRIVLAAGAIPAASVIYLRRKIPETARYLARIKGDTKKLSEVIKTISGKNASINVNTKDNLSFKTYFKGQWLLFLTACLLWFLYDIVTYAGILFGPTKIAASIGIHNPAIFQFITEFGFTVPGALIAVAFIDRVGRKPLQTIGFIGMALSLLVFSLIPTAYLATFGLLLYGLNLLSQQAGPGSISASGMLGVELAPTKVRSIVQALTVASGRIGATLTSFVFPYLFATYGLTFAIGFLSAISFIAAILTMLIIPETKGKPLEEASQEVKYQAIIE